MAVYMTTYAHRHRKPCDVRGKGLDIYRKSRIASSEACRTESGCINECKKLGLKLICIGRSAVHVRIKPCIIICFTGRNTPCQRPFCKDRTFLKITAYPDPYNKTGWYLK